MSRVEGVLLGGLVAGVLKTVLAIGLYRVSSTVVYQSVASGLLGKEAFRGGWGTAALGCLLHFIIAFTAAAVYFGASLKLHVLVRRPVEWGLAFGVAVYFFMNYLVVPLSAAREDAFSWGALIGHAFLVGLPIALAVHGATRAHTRSLPGS